jgi:hypothetical protein
MGRDRPQRIVAKGFCEAVDCGRRRPADAPRRAATAWTQDRLLPLIVSAWLFSDDQQPAVAGLAQPGFKCAVSLGKGTDPGLIQSVSQVSGLSCQHGVWSVLSPPPCA